MFSVRGFTLVSKDVEKVKLVLKKVQMKLNLIVLN